MRLASGIHKSIFKDVYYSMRGRCEHKNHDAYYRYGGRGITVCKEWRDYPLLFVEWALTHGYKKGLTLDRIDNDKGYSPDNCRWATPSEQGYNTRVSVRYDGRTMKELSDISGVSEKTINDRLLGGYTTEEAMQKSVKGKSRKDARHGIPYKVLSEKYGIPATTLSKRFSRGWTFERAIKK